MEQLEKLRDESRGKHIFIGAKGAGEISTARPVEQGTFQRLQAGVGMEAVVCGAQGALKRAVGQVGEGGFSAGVGEGEGG